MRDSITEAAPHAELQRGLRTDSAWIDSDIFAFFEQRFATRNYVRLVADELRQMEESVFVHSALVADEQRREAQRAEEVAEQEAVVEARRESVIEPQSVKLNVKVSQRRSQDIIIRRMQFQSKIAEIQDEISFCTQTVKDCVNRRAELQNLLRATEKLLAEVRSELDVAHAFRGRYMDSVVIHGCRNDMRQRGSSRFFRRRLINR